MTSNENPGAPNEGAWDFIVVGTGMGGATIGYALAKKGWRVLFLEKGPFVHRTLASAPHELNDAVLDHAAMSAEFLEAGSPSRFAAGKPSTTVELRTEEGISEITLPIGSGSGGSTAFFAAGLERFAPTDFAPRQNFPDVADTSLPDAWPIDYEELSPYYDQAEKLYSVRGTPDPLFPGKVGPLQEPVPMGPRDQELKAFLEARGLHPYQVHAGFRLVPNCEGCIQGPCPRDCKRDSAWTCLMPALLHFGARIVPDCEVVGLDADGSRVRRVICEKGGAQFAVSARTVILAAGAFFSPMILLRSRSDLWPDGLANGSGQVGRNLMFHAGDFIAISSRGHSDFKGPMKTLALNDFYQAPDAKLGTFQTLGVGLEIGNVMQHLQDSVNYTSAWWSWFVRPESAWWSRFVRPLLKIGVALFLKLSGFLKAGIWATIIEDLPYAHHRLYLHPDNDRKLVMEYTLSSELRRRIVQFREKLAARIGSSRMMVLTPTLKIDYPHVCGTCRFGDDPRTSVLDRNNKAHELENLYVADSSFFPSSGGTNPSLTVAANALRVAEILDARSRGMRHDSVAISGRA
jgi:choline dehydrogenase-like flavoprotein